MIKFDVFWELVSSLFLHRILGGIIDSWSSWNKVFRRKVLLTKCFRENCFLVIRGSIFGVIYENWDDLWDYRGTNFGTIFGTRFDFSVIRWAMGQINLALISGWSMKFANLSVGLSLLAPPVLPKKVTLVLTLNTSIANRGITKTKKTRTESYSHPSRSILLQLPQASQIRKTHDREIFGDLWIVQCGGVRLGGAPPPTPPPGGGPGAPAGPPAINS